MNLRAEPLQRSQRDGRVGIERVPPATMWRVIATAHKIATVHVHFYDGRTRPCSLPEAPCPACDTGLAKRFEAYLGCFNLTRNVPMLLALPEGAYHQVAAAVGEAVKGEMRGTRWIFARKYESRRSPLSAEFVGREENPANIPNGLDVIAILYRCWGLSVPPSEAAKASVERHNPRFPRK